jgi:hypothetical protein
VVALHNVGRRRQLACLDSRPVVPCRVCEPHGAPGLNPSGSRLHGPPGPAEEATCPRCSGLVADLIGQRKRLGAVQLRGLDIAADHRDPRSPRKRPRAQPGPAVAAGVERARVGQLCLREAAAGAPPAVQRRAEAQRQRRLAAKCPVDRGRQVGRLGIEQLEPLALATRLEMGSRVFRQRQTHIAVAAADRVLLTGGGQPLEPVLAHRLEQPVTHPGTALVGDHQRLVDQRPKQVEHPLLIEPGAGRKVLHCVEHEAAGEHGHPAQ